MKQKSLTLSVYINEDGKPVLLEEDRPIARAFYGEHKKEWLEMILNENGEQRTTEMNKRYWKILSYFIPDHFDSVEQAHEHFTTELLRRDEIINLNEDDLTKSLKEIYKKAKKVISIIPINDNVEILWIKSTASLNKAEFTNYVDAVIRTGAENGIIFQ